MRILLVEDGSNTGAYIRKGLMENGFAVDVAAGHSSQTIDRVYRVQYDLLVCDGMAGWPGLAEFRRTGQQTPVLFLTAGDGGPQPVALEPAADNCLKKPFAFSDFLTRVRSMLRWGPARVLDTVQIADLELDLVRHRGTRAGKRLDLTRKEFLLLSLLMRRAGEVLSRTVIADQVWDINFDSNTNFVDVHIRRLRSKVDDPFEKKLIHTVRGVGYVLEDRP
jgi:two-component system copper resistance phosphate regulon response regulator CusR